MAISIDRQLELEATMKTERLDKLIEEKVKDLLEHPSFVHSLYKWHLAQAMLEEMVTHSDFDSAVKTAIDRNMGAIVAGINNRQKVHLPE
jgi:hypothetical protein